MKKLIILLAICNLQFVICNSLFAQSPQSFKYQSVVRDASGVLAANRIISIRTSILAGSATGSSVYTETQTLSTNDYGVVSLNIGAGTVVSGNFTTINWGTTDYFVKTELDINGGNTYIFMGTSQILSVPYALYAEKAGSSLNDHDTSSTNELQTLSLIGDSLHISKGNAVYLSGVVDLDSDPTNELQNLTLNNDTLKISRTNSTVVFPHDNDRDSTNELQNLSINNDTISISKGNKITIPHTSINGTLNQIAVTNTGNNFTLSTPQDIATTSSPSFSGMNLTNTPLNLSSGGTNSNLTATSGGIVYSNSTQLNISSAGNSGQYLTSGGTGTPTWTTPVTSGNMFVVSSVNGAVVATGTKVYANQIAISPIYIPATITVNLMSFSVTSALGTNGDVGVYDSNFNLILNGGSGSVSTYAGLKTITPIQTGAARTLAPGQYYVAVTWNSTTGTIGGASLGNSGQIRHSGLALGGGLVLPSSTNSGSIIDYPWIYAITLSNN